MAARVAALAAIFKKPCACKSAKAELPSTLSAWAWVLTTQRTCAPSWQASERLTRQPTARLGPGSITSACAPSTTALIGSTRPKLAGEISASCSGSQTQTPGATSCQSTGAAVAQPGGAGCRVLG